MTKYRVNYSQQVRKGVWLSSRSFLVTAESPKAAVSRLKKKIKHSQYDAFTVTSAS